MMLSFKQSSVIFTNDTIFVEDCNPHIYFQSCKNVHTGLQSLVRHVNNLLKSL